MAIQETTFAARLRPVAAAIAGIFATASVPAMLAPSYASSTAHLEGTNIVVTNCDDHGAGSLRAALGSAANNDTIDLTQLACARISVVTGALTTQQPNLTIVGPGQHKLAIDAGVASSVIYHGGTGTLRISGVSIVNGNVHRTDKPATGGCVHTDGNLRLEDVTVSHCIAGSGNAQPALGGAVFVQGYAAIIRSTISGGSANIITGTGKAIGGGLYAGKNLYMHDSTVADNTAFTNAGGGYGGGVCAQGTINISASLISKNRADNFGGLFFVYARGYAATITNSTVSGNTASASVGGIASTIPLNIYNSTIAFNRSSLSGTGIHTAAGVFISAPNATLSSTIVSNNVNAGSPYRTDDFSGFGVTITGENNNVGFCVGVDCPPDTTHDDPGLRPLQDNGGPTRTHVPTPGAWDAGHGINRRGAVWDQRGIGFPRAPFGVPIEIGAFQTNPEILFVNGFN